jgi:hypothetical protein
MPRPRQISIHATFSILPENELREAFAAQIFLGDGEFAEKRLLRRLDGCFVSSRHASSRLCDDVVQHLAMNIGQSKITARIAVG